MEKKVYLSPKIEVLYVAVEQGFAASGTADDDSFVPPFIP